MTDLEMTRLCAEAMGYTPYESKFNPGKIRVGGGGQVDYYDPLHDDAHAMPLLLFLLTSGEKVVIENNERGTRPILVFRNTVYEIFDTDKLRRAVVECVAKIQSGKEG